MRIDNDDAGLSGAGDEHVLIFDGGDDANGDDTGSALADDLVHAGARVTRAHDPLRALACLDLDEAPTLVVVDLRMPRMQAWGFLREKGRLRSAAHLPTVLLQAPSTRGTTLTACAAGVVGHLEAHAGARAVLRFSDRTQRRSTDVQLVRAWYRSDLLAELSEALGNVLELDSLLERVAQLLVPSFAEWCVIRTRLPAGEITPVSRARAHHDPLRTRLLDGLVLEPMLRVLDSGRSELHRIDGWGPRLAITGSEDGARRLHEIGVSSLLVMPLTSNGVVLGAIALGRHPGDYDTLDHQLAEDAAHRVAMALDVAVHHALAQRAARAREDLLAIVSHDLRIPLTTITMVATKVRRSPGTEEGTRRDADTILRNLRRMDRLIGDLLDCSRLETGRLRVEVGRCKLIELLAQAVDAARPLAGTRAVCLEAPAATDGPVVTCDKERVLQILDNLIGNALKFTPEHGTVTVRAELRERDARVVVADTGCGIAPEQLPHLFEQYWQGRGGDPFDARRGVGLGLFITKGLVEAQGGVVKVESVPGVGSAFSFTLPLEDAAGATSVRGLRPIVVVEDDLAFRREVMEVLEREGYDVIGFAHGKAALEYLKISPRPGLVLMDLVMPVMDGWALASAMQSDPSLAAVPIVIISGEAPTTDRVEVHQFRQVVARLPKPASPDHLLRTVAEHCGWFPSGTHRVHEPTLASDAVH